MLVGRNRQIILQQTNKCRALQKNVGFCKTQKEVCLLVVGLGEILKQASGESDFWVDVVQASAPSTGRKLLGL